MRRFEIKTVDTLRAKRAIMAMSAFVRIVRREVVRRLVGGEAGFFAQARKDCVAGKIGSRVARLHRR